MDLGTFEGILSSIGASRPRSARLLGSRLRQGISREFKRTQENSRNKNVISIQGNSRNFKE